MNTARHELATLLRTRMEARYGTKEAGGHHKLRDMLAARYGLDVTRVAVTWWITGERWPSRESFPVLLDALDIYGEDREQARKLFFNGDHDVPAEQHEPNAAPEEAA